MEPNYCISIAQVSFNFKYFELDGANLRRPSARLHLARFDTVLS